MSTTKAVSNSAQTQNNGQGRRYLNGAMSGIVEVWLIYIYTPILHGLQSNLVFPFLPL